MVGWRRGDGDYYGDERLNHYLSNGLFIALGLFVEKKGEPRI